MKATSDQRKTAIARTPIALKLLLAIGVLALLCIVAYLTFAMRFFSGENYIEGAVVDSSTGQSVAGASVVVSNRGWGFTNGQLLWDKDYTYKDTSDENGRFRIEFSVGSGAHITATKEGYQSFEGLYERNSAITINLKKADAAYQPLPHGFLELGMRDGKPFGWVFSDKRTTLDAQEADIFPSISSAPRSVNISFTISAPGGITFVPNSQLGGSLDPLVYTDVAPQQGYTPNAQFQVQQKGGVYFVRTRGNSSNSGQYYAKFASSSTVVGSEAEIQQGNWSVRFEYVYNPDGSPNLTFQR